jgi:hypothetical protein
LLFPYDYLAGLPDRTAARLLPGVRLSSTLWLIIIEQVMSSFSYSRNIRHGAGLHAIGTPIVRYAWLLWAAIDGEFVSDVATRGASPSVLRSATLPTVSEADRVPELADAMVQDWL